MLHVRPRQYCLWQCNQLLRYSITTFNSERRLTLKEEKEKSSHAIYLFNLPTYSQYYSEDLAKKIVLAHTNVLLVLPNETHFHNEIRHRNLSVDLLNQNSELSTKQKHNAHETSICRNPHNSAFQFCVGGLQQIAVLWAGGFSKHDTTQFIWQPLNSWRTHWLQAPKLNETRCIDRNKVLQNLTLKRVKTEIACDVLHC